MSCPCGSSICDCRVECLCSLDQCQCNKCSLLPKICSRCNLPFYIIVHQRENVESACCFKVKNKHFHSKSHHLSGKSSAYSENTISSIRQTQCPRCSLPIIIVTKSADPHTVNSCCCSHKNSDSNTTGTSSTEHETSNSTSDHRELSGDRQVRKTSRRTRTEKSIWQYMKAKGNNHLTNSDEDDSDTETLTSEEFLAEDSKNHSEKNQKSRVPCTGSETSDSNLPNFNLDSSVQSPIGLFSRSGDNSISNASLLANTSGLSSPSTSKDLIILPESFGFFQLSKNVRPKFPPPFPTLPKPIPGLPSFRGCGGRDSSLQVKRPHSGHPPVTYQPALAPAEKMEKWFGTIQSVMSARGELPDAETAAALDKKDKEKIKWESTDLSDCQFESECAEKYIEPFTSSKSTSLTSHFKPYTNYQKNGKYLNVTDPTTNTERSSSLSKSRKESESDSQ